MSDDTPMTERLLGEIAALRARVVWLEQEAQQAEAERSRLVKQAAEVRAEVAIERARCHALLMDMPAAIVVLRGREMVAELANPLYLSLIGRKDIIGKPLREFFPELVEQGFLEILQGVYSSGEPFIGFEVPVRIHIGDSGVAIEGWYTFTYQPLHEPDGTRSGVLVHVMEVTEQVVARRKLQAEIGERRLIEEQLQAEVRERAQAEEELRAKLAVIQRQEEAILALATPILRIWDGVLALPVIGTVDSARAGRMMEGLLGMIVDTQTRFAIVDLTGVDRMDSHATDHLLRLVRAAGLLGSRCLVSGISPRMAQTVVALNLELAGFMSFNTLESALRYAIRHLESPAEVRVRERREGRRGEPP